MITKQSYKIITILILQACVLHAQKWISAPTKDGIPIFRHTYRIAKPIQRAIIHTSALGVYTFSINGKEIDDEQLKPGWTDYRKEIFYQTQIIPSSLFKGDTLCIEAQVSRGWWAGGISRGIYGRDIRNAFICWIELSYKDGTTERLASDTTWLCATDGPLSMGDIYDGETYDARRRPQRWQPVVLNTDPKGKLVSEMGPKVKIRNAELWRKPLQVTIYEGSRATGTTYGQINVVRSLTHFSPILLKKGQTLLIDFGQNMVGWPEFSVQGERGTELTFRFGEMLNYNGDERRLDKGPAGSLWTYNLRTAEATLRYILRGGGKPETYHPRHTFFGFRYAEMTATSDVWVQQIVGQVVGSDINEWGDFACSNDDINQLYSNIWWSQRGNFLSIPTDCPQRDERLGWTGDTQIFSTTALYNADTKDFYRKWMRDMRNSQREDGAYCCTAPAANMWGYGGSAWGDAGIIVPWNVYVMTGDRQILVENYESMKRWMQHCADQHEPGWEHIGAETDFGDWLAYRELEKRYVSYAYYAHTSQLMSHIAQLLGKADTTYYTQLHADIVREFQRRYITDGKINTGQDTQTAYLLALHFGLLTEEQRPAAMQALRQNIQDNGYRLSTGFVGTGILMETLTECHMTDLAYRLLLQRENPSWLYSIDQGATTVWERWDSYTLSTGFHKHEWNMNSFNHYSYGAVAEWFYSTILGIRPAVSQPGFVHVILSPHPGGNLTWAKGHTTTPHGRISASWKRLADGRYKYSVSLPPHTTATLIHNGDSIALPKGTRHRTFILDFQHP